MTGLFPVFSSCILHVYNQQFSMGNTRRISESTFRLKGKRWLSIETTVPAGWQLGFWNIVSRVASLILGIVLPVSHLSDEVFDLRKRSLASTHALYFGSNIERTRLEPVPSSIAWRQRSRYWKRVPCWEDYIEWLSDGRSSLALGKSTLNLD